MDFSSQEEFEVHVHKCFEQIFNRLMKIDAIIKDGAEKEENERNYGVFNELQDYVEEVILHCHLAWQYHRLSRLTAGNTWQRLADKSGEEK